MSFIQSLPKLLRRTSAVKQAAPDHSLLAYYVAPDGRMHAVKSSSASMWPGGAYSRAPISSSPEGYAQASIVSVWAGRCIYLRATNINRLDWHVRNKKTKERIENHPLQIAIERNRQRIMRKFEWSSQIWGESFLWPRKNDYDYYSDLVWLNNLSIDVDTAQGYIRRYQYSPLAGGRTHIFERDELAFIYSDNPFDDLRGLSPFEHILVEVGIDRDIARTTKSFYANDARPGIVLIPEETLDPTGAQEFTDYWNKNFRGPDNAGKTGLLPRRIKEIKEIQRPPTIDDVDTRESVRREICAAFGVPLSIAGAWDDAQYQSAPEQRKSFYEETIIPRAEEIAQDWTTHVLPYFDDSGKTEVAFEADVLLALVENTQEKTTAANSKLTSGGITLNEYRVELGHDALPNGDVLYMPSNVQVVPVDQLGQTAPAQPAPQLEADHGNTITVEPIEIRTQYPNGVQDAAIDELRAWRKSVDNARLKGRVAKDFHTYLIHDAIAEPLRAYIKTATSAEQVRDAFDRAIEQARIKAIQATRLDFEGDFETLLSNARSENIDRRTFGLRTRTLLRKYGERAYRDGLADGGVEIAVDEPLSDDDRASLNIALGEQSQYVTEFGAVLFKGDGISDNAADVKPGMWFNKSVMPLYQAGLASADANGMYEWVYGPTEHCEDCLRLNGQRHRLRAWAKNGLMPQSDALTCGGFNCQCKLQRVNSKARGAF